MQDAATVAIYPHLKREDQRGLWREWAAEVRAVRAVTPERIEAQENRPAAPEDREKAAAWLAQQRGWPIRVKRKATEAVVEAVAQDGEA